MIDGVFGDDAVPGVVGDLVVEKLRRAVVDLRGVCVGDFGGDFEELLVGSDVEVVAGYVDAFADVAGCDALRDLIGGLVGVFGDFAMAFFVVGDGLRGVGGDPDVRLELQRHQHLGDGEDRVRGIGASGLTADAGAGDEVGVADRGFTGMQRRHGWWWGGGIEFVILVRGGEFCDLDGIF